MMVEEDQRGRDELRDNITRVERTAADYCSQLEEARAQLEQVRRNQIILEKT